MTMGMQQCFLLDKCAIISYDSFELSLGLSVLAHWVMLLSLSGISDEWVCCRYYKTSLGVIGIFQK